MNIPEIKHKLIDSHKCFTDYIINLPDNIFTESKNGKWSPGQQLDHIRRSVQPLALGFRLPVWLIKTIFVKSNRQGRTYESLVTKYEQKLQEGGRASGRFIPKEIKVADRKKLVNSLMRDIQSLTRSIQKFSEADLENTVLPHPLLGKITIREMMFFTIHHVEHHLNLIRKNISL
jgi:hypothetical protein